MASKLDRDGAKFTRDRIDTDARARGHRPVWRLAPNATRKGYAYYFIGTCEHCGGNAHAGSAWSSCSSVVDIRTEQCGGPGTHILTEIETGRLHELMTLAIAEFAGNVRRRIAEMN